MRPTKFLALISLTSLTAPSIQASEIGSNDETRLPGFFEHFTSAFVDALRSLGVGYDDSDCESIDVSSSMNTAEISAREPNVIHMAYQSGYSNVFDYDTEIFYKYHVNKIEITPEFIIQPEDKIILSITDRESKGPKIKELSLAEMLLDGAVFFNNTERLNLLIEKGVHHCISDAQKVQILLRAVNNVHGIFVGERCFNTMRILLENGFYCPNALKTAGSYPFSSVFDRPEALKVFLEYDPDFFRKITSHNYVKYFFDYKMINEAERALEAGCDPKIEERGMNALDIALNKEPISMFRDKYYQLVTANSRNIHQVQELERKREHLIQKMKNEYGVRISMTKENYDNCCYKKRYSDAIRIIESGKLTKKNAEDSLNTAIETRDPDLISAALDTFLDVLPADRLKWTLMSTKLTGHHPRHIFNAFFDANKRILNRLMELGETKESLRHYM